jgi:hypothetical protein
VLGFVDQIRPVSGSTIGLSGLSGELWIVPLLTGTYPAVPRHAHADAGDEESIEVRTLLAFA